MLDEHTVTQDRRLSQLADRLELQDLLATLAHAIDRSDRDLVAACYTEDSMDDHGGFKGTGAEFADYICGGSTISKTARMLQHVLGQSRFEIDGDQAFGESAYMFDMITAEGHLMHSSGRYIDRFRRVGGAWLVHHRKVVSDGTFKVDATALPQHPDALTSTRDRTDPVYHR